MATRAGGLGLNAGTPGYLHIHLDLGKSHLSTISITSCSSSVGIIIPQSSAHVERFIVSGMEDTNKQTEHITTKCFISWQFLQKLSRQKAFWARLSSLVNKRFDLSVPLCGRPLARGPDYPIMPELWPPSCRQMAARSAVPCEQEQGPRGSSHGREETFDLFGVN